MVEEQEKVEENPSNYWKENYTPIRINKALWEKVLKEARAFTPKCSGMALLEVIIVEWFSRREKKKSNSKTKNEITRNLRKGK